MQCCRWGAVWPGWFCEAWMSRTTSNFTKAIKHWCSLHIGMHHRHLGIVIPPYFLNQWHFDFCMCAVCRIICLHSCCVSCFAFSNFYFILYLLCLKCVKPQRSKESKFFREGNGLGKWVRFLRRDQWMERGVKWKGAEAEGHAGHLFQTCSPE